jgi:hypothetical protein
VGPQTHDTACAKVADGLLPALEVLEAEQTTYNKVIRGVHGIAERANSLLKTTSKAPTTRQPVRLAQQHHQQCRPAPPQTQMTSARQPPHATTTYREWLILRGFVTAGCHRILRLFPALGTLRNPCKQAPMEHPHRSMAHTRASFAK